MIGLCIGQFAPCGHETFVTPSRSQPGVLRRLWVGADGRVRCDCPGYRFHQRCWHAASLTEQLPALTCRYCNHISANGDEVVGGTCIDLVACVRRREDERIVRPFAPLVCEECGHTSADDDPVVQEYVRVHDGLSRWIVRCQDWVTCDRRWHEARGLPWRDWSRPALPAEVSG